MKRMKRAGKLWVAALALAVAVQTNVAYAAQTAGEATVSDLARKEDKTKANAIRVKAEAKADNVWPEDGTKAAGVRAEAGTKADNALPEDEVKTDGSQPETGGAEVGKEPTGGKDPEDGKAPETGENPGEGETPGNGENPDDGNDPSAPAPAAPKNLSVCYKDSRTAARLTWEESEGAVRYRIFRKSEAGSFEELAVTEETSYLDETIKESKAYIYRVVPENEDGVQGESAEVKLIPAPRPAARLRTTCESEKKVLLEWDECEFAKRYIIYRRTAGGSYKQLGETKKTRYRDTSFVWGKQYSYKVIAVNENGLKGKGAVLAFKPAQAVNVKSQKYSYTQMETDMKELAALYSGYCTMQSVGKSVQGREIYDFAIGNPDAEKSMLVVCTLHAREYICSVMAMQQIEYYLRSYNKKIGGIRPSELLSDMQIHYIVMANPDGIMISQTKYSRWKSNANGVDLNRNFPASPFKVGGKKGQEGYSGSKALSEPESRAVSGITKRLKKKQGLAGVVNYHAMGQIVFGDCSSKAIAKDTKTMYDLARSLTGYRSAAGYSSGTPSSGGGYREYVMYKLGLPSITIEVGATAAPCAFSEYSSVFRKNQKVVLSIANALK